MCNLRKKLLIKKIMKELVLKRIDWAINDVYYLTLNVCQAHRVLFWTVVQ
jgi:hypothetical protein